MEIAQGVPKREYHQFSIQNLMEIVEGQPKPESRRFSIRIQLEYNGIWAAAAQAIIISVIYQKAIKIGKKLIACCTQLVLGHSLTYTPGYVWYDWLVCFVCSSET